MLDNADNEIEGRFYAYETERVVLKNLTHIELKGSFPHWLNDPSVNTYSHFRNRHMSYEYCKNYVEALAEDHSKLIWACYCKDTGVHFANVSLETIDFDNGSAEFYCYIGEKSYWAKGYGYELGQLALNHGFNDLGLNRIACRVPAAHDVMIKLADKLGFVKEGVSRKAIKIDKDFIDVIEYGLLREEYEDSGG